MARRAYFVIATGKFKEYAKLLEKSLRKFDKETELIIFEEKDIPADPEFFYRATPYFAKKLFEAGYTEICHLDSDQIITGNLDHIWEGEYDVATVLNDPTMPIRVFDISPYFNNGLNVFKSKEFVEHWLRLCYTPHFGNFQYREQDLLNILCSDYHNYKVKCLDLSYPKIHGEFAKPIWIQAQMIDGKVMIPPPPGLPGTPRELCVVHFGGGSNSPEKMNFRIKFKEGVAAFISELVK